MFVLIVDDFGIEYVGDERATSSTCVTRTLHHHNRLGRGKFAGIDIEWNYTKNHADRTCRLSMKKYIHNLLVKFDHPKPLKPQLSPHRHREIQYGAKVQKAIEDDTSAPLDAAGIKCVQGIVGALLYYARAVDNKLLVAINSIGTQQAAATEATAAAISQLLNYVATYPNDVPSTYPVT
jgi:hypothetical protein